MSGAAAESHPDGAPSAPPLTPRSAKWLWPVLWLLALGALGLGAHLIDEFAEGGSYGFDTRLLLALRVPGHPNTPIGPKWLEQSAIDLSALGGFTLQWLLGGATVGFLWLARRRAEAAWLTASIVGASVANALIKLIVDRPRPTVVDHLANVSNASFPSGHAMISTAILLTVGVMLAETQKTAVARTYLMAGAGVLSVLIGVSRIYLGVHWPTDVLAGWCFGAVWALVVFAANRALRRRAARLPVLEADPARGRSV